MVFFYTEIIRKAHEKAFSVIEPLQPWMTWLWIPPRTFSWIKDKQQRENASMAQNLLLAALKSIPKWQLQSAAGLDLYCIHLNTTVKKNEQKNPKNESLLYFRHSGRIYFFINIVSCLIVQIILRYSFAVNLLSSDVKCNGRHWHRIFCKGWNFPKQRPF